MNRDHELDAQKMDNVVNFPFGGSERVSTTSKRVDLGDPLEELLNEFSDWEIEEDEWEPIETNLKVDLESLFPAPSSNVNSDDEIELLTHQISLLEDVTKRMKFYIDEIELFTPHLK